MAERHDERRHVDPIVPDPTASLTAHRPRQSSSARLWPLWLMVFLMLGALGGAGYLAWEERERLQADIERLQGELSNVHARFDADREGEEGLETLDARQAALEKRDEERAERFEALEQALGAGLGEHGEWLDDVEERLGRLEEAAQTRDALLAANQLSLDALERTGTEGRAALASTLDGVKRDLEALEEGLAELAEERREGQSEENLHAVLAEQQALAERLDERETQARESIDAFEQALADLAAELEALAAARDDDRQNAQARAARLTALELDVSELRRTQLALSARLEALRP